MIFEKWDDKNCDEKPIKIHNGWAFTLNEKEKAKDNFNYFQKIKNKFIVLSRKSEVGSNVYRIAPKNIVEEYYGIEALLFADDGNLCFGGIIEQNALKNGVNDPWEKYLGSVIVRVWTD